MADIDFFAIGNLLYADSTIEFIDDSTFSLFEKRSCLICKKDKYGREFLHMPVRGKKYLHATAICLDCHKK